MDYKQKYEQALERARCYKELRTEMSIVFPELIESKDERIRRALIRDIGIAMPVETAQKYIAWLEKQGEQKPTWSEEDEKEISKLIKFFMWEDKGYRFTIEDCLEATNWLKSLKQRMKGE